MVRVSHLVFIYSCELMKFHPQVEDFISFCLGVY